jgi:hypothetical protein
MRHLCWTRHTWYEHQVHFRGWYGAWSAERGCPVGRRSAYSYHQPQSSPSVRELAILALTHPDIKPLAK